MMHDQERSGTQDWFHITRREPVMSPTEFAQYLADALLTRWLDGDGPCREEAPISA